MLTPRIVVNSVVALAIALFIGTANAFMIGLDGATSNGSDALYALDRHGREVKIAQTGTVGPDWVMVEDIGLPTIASDGTVLFGAARESNHQVRWSMFVAQPDSGAVLNVVLPDSFEDGSSLEMKADPRPQQTSDGGIIFLAHESSQESSGHQPSDHQASEDDALFKIAHGKLQRLVRTGERLSDGRTVHLIAFGSIRPESQGGIAFSGYLEPGGQAEMMVSESGEMTILALQDQPLPNSEHFTSFGLPASTVTADGPMVAFTARTDRGDGLFTFARGKLNKVLAQSASCGPGHIDYLSNARPALNSEGALAIRGRCSGTEGIFLARHGNAELIVSAAQATHSGTRLDRLGDPMLSESTVFFGALTTDGDSSLFNIFEGKINQIVPLEKPETNVAFPVTVNRHTIETTSVSINQRGQLAYLGSP